MSRIGRQPIAIPAGVEVVVDQSRVSVKGPLGSLEQTFHPDMRIVLEDGTLRVERPDDERLTGLAKVQAVVSQADAAVHDYVDVLRGRGISWTRIGEALGVSRQAAWERFSGED